MTTLTDCKGMLENVTKIEQCEKNATFEQFHITKAIKSIVIN